MSDGLKILIVGGYGVFGGRLVDLLLDQERLTLLVAGRSLDKAKAFCLARKHARARLVPTMFDRNGDLSVQLASEKPDLCVDASGPFQHYGAASHALVEACIAQQVDYLDLADGSDFVVGVSAFDAQAKVAGTYVLSGVSSFPVLTAAVVRRLSFGLASVTSITGGIAPSPYAGVGENVIRAIASYAGQPVTVRRDGTDVTEYPFTNAMRFVISPPGFVPLRRTLFSLVDVPDLRLLQPMWPEVSTVWMGAGPVPEALHRALIVLSWFVRWHVVSSLSSMSGLIHRVTNRIKWGEHRGGMFVQLDGLSSSGESVRRSWHLLAEGDDGPLIPSMAVEAIVHRILRGEPPAPGARPAVREVELADYDALFARRAIYTGVREDSSSWRSQHSLYQRILGPAWERLPAELCEIHDGSVGAATGTATVRRGSGLMATIAAMLFRFPHTADDVAVTVRFKANRDGESWTRTFGDRSFSSRLQEGRGASERLLCECFGPFAFAQAVVVEDNKLRLVMRRCTVFGLPLPRWLTPRSNTYETVRDGRYSFFVELSHPLVGLIVRYEGWLQRFDEKRVSIARRTR